MDYILNGAVHGNLGRVLLNANFDPDALRPWMGVDKDNNPTGQTFITQNVGGKPKSVLVHNAAATLRKDEWIELDEAVLKAARQRLRIVADIRGAGLEFNISNGMAKTVLQYQDQSDGGTARISMDPRTKSTADRPQYDLLNLPLPIIHSDFSFGAREIAVSRNMNTPLDTTQAEQSGVRVSEEIEKLTLGEIETYTYGGGTISGLTNFPSRLTKTLTAPTSSNHATTVKEVLEMKTQSQDANHFGPWMLYNSNAFDQFLDEDYSTAKGDNTLRDRLKRIDGIQDVRPLDFLSGTVLLLVQMTTNVVRMVVGMEITTLQWETMGGLEQNFKVMAIIIPQLRADQNSNTGIVHGSV